VADYPNLCIDTQSGVRNDQGEFDVDAHKHYTLEAINRLYSTAPVG
jgi:hypothetical protein